MQTWFMNRYTICQTVALPPKLRAELSNIPISGRDLRHIPCHRSGPLTTSRISVTKAGNAVNNMGPTAMDPALNGFPNSGRQTVAAFLLAAHHPIMLDDYFTVSRSCRTSCLPAGNMRPTPCG